MFSFSLSPSVRVWHACLHTAATLNGILSQRKDHHHHESSSIYFFISKVKDPFCCIPITIFYNPHSHKTTFCSTPFHIQNCYYVHFIRYQILIGVQHIHCLNNISIVLTYMLYAFQIFHRCLVLATWYIFCLFFHFRSAPPFVELYFYLYVDCHFILFNNTYFVYTFFHSIFFIAPSILNS